MEQVMEKHKPLFPRAPQAAKSIVPIYTMPLRSQRDRTTIPLLADTLLTAKSDTSSAAKIYGTHHQHPASPLRVVWPVSPPGTFLLHVHSNYITCMFIRATTYVHDWINKSYQCMIISTDMVNKDVEVMTCKHVLTLKTNRFTKTRYVCFLAGNRQGTRKSFECLRTAYLEVYLCILLFFIQVRACGCFFFSPRSESCAYPFFYHNNMGVLTRSLAQPSYM